MKIFIPKSLKIELIGDEVDTFRSLLEKVVISAISHEEKIMLDDMFFVIDQESRK